jgi:hypothetical protein
MNTWFIVEVTDSDHGPEPLGEMKRFRVGPHFQVFEEPRSNDEIIYAATEKGYDVAYASSLFGASRLHLERIRLAILSHLRHTLHVNLKNQFDVNIEPVLRVMVRL